MADNRRKVSGEEKLMRSRRITDSGCWEWTQGVSSGGYPALSDESNRWWLAHRLAWSLWRGSIPRGLKVLHRCDNPRCFNPEHLFLGTQQDNLADCARKGRAPQRDIAGVFRSSR